MVAFRSFDTILIHELISFFPGLDDLQLHHIVVNTWEGGVDCEQNVGLISIPSVIDPDFAPPGKHALHSYVPATEPFDIWKGLDRNRYSANNIYLVVLAVHDAISLYWLIRWTVLL